MSTVKSSSENLTLNADCVGSNVVIQNNGTETVRVDDSGTVTATSLTADTLTNQDIQLCKAWVNFNGTGTVAIRDSYNVSSITDNGTGNYTVNFANAMSNTNYSFSGSSEFYNNRLCVLSQSTAGSKTPSSLPVITGYAGAGSYNGAPLDMSDNHVHVFGS